MRVSLGFRALYTELVLPGELELEIVIERMTSGGALYGLPTPRIAPGESANLCLVDLGMQFEVGAHGYTSRSANCCFHGRTMHGSVLLTLAEGAARTKGIPMGNEELIARALHETDEADEGWRRVSRRERPMSCGWRQVTN